MIQERSPDPIPLAIVVVNYHCTAEIKRLLDSIGRSLLFGVNLQVWIVNNSPQDFSLESLPEFQSFSTQIIDSPDNIGFGRACNLAIAQLWSQQPRPWIWLLNPDTTVRPNTLHQWVSLVGNGTKNSWAIAGTTVETNAGQPEFNGGYWNPNTGEIYPLTQLALEEKSIPTPWVSGCSLMLNPNGFGDEIPEFDSDFFLYYEDFEFCQRYIEKLRSLTAPHPVVLLSQIIVTHHTSSVIGRTPTQKTAWAIEGYLLALEKCAPRWVWIRRLIRIGLTSLVGLLRDKPGKWMGFFQYLKHHFRKRL